MFPATLIIFLSSDTSWQRNFIFIFFPPTWMKDPCLDPSPVEYNEGCLSEESLSWQVGLIEESAEYFSLFHVRVFGNTSCTLITDKKHRCDNILYRFNMAIFVSSDPFMYPPIFSRSWWLSKESGSLIIQRFRVRASAEPPSDFICIQGMQLVSSYINFQVPAGHCWPRTYNHWIC